MSEATPRTIYSGKFVAKEKLDKAQAELAELREAITKHKDSFNNPDDYTEEDRALWALLQGEG